MKTRAGTWIEPGKAMVMIITNKGEEIGLIISRSTRPARRAGDKAGGNPGDRPHALMGHLNHHYDAVVVNAGDAEFILLFGSGAAAGGPQAAFGTDAGGGSGKTLATIDRKTNRQIAARVHRHFTG